MNRPNRITSLAAAIAVGLSLVVAASMPETAGAKTVAIHGDLKCSIAPSEMQLHPPLALFHPGDRQTRSRNTFNALVSDCRGTTSTSPAPGGISWGLMDLKGRLWPNSCQDLSAPGAAGFFLQGPQRLTVTWYNANGDRLGRHRYRASERGLEFVFDEYFGLPLSPIATVPITSVVRSAAKLFGAEAISTQIPVDLTDFSNRCIAGPVDTLPLLGGEISIGSPL